MVCFGDSFVCLNAFLGELVREDEEVRELANEIAGEVNGDGEHLRGNGSSGSKDVEDNGEDGTRRHNRIGSNNGNGTIRSIDSTEQTALLALASSSGTGDEPPLNPQPLPLPLQHSQPVPSPSKSDELQSRYASLISLKTTQVSSLGIGIGYSSGVSILCLTLIPIQRFNGSLGVLKSVIGFTGAWWGLFTIPAIFWLPGANEGERRRGGGIMSMSRDKEERDLVKRKVGEGWKRLGGLSTLR